MALWLKILPMSSPITVCQKFHAYGEVVDNGEGNQDDGHPQLTCNSSCLGIVILTSNLVSYALILQSMFYCCCCKQW